MSRAIHSMLLALTVSSVAACSSSSGGGASTSPDDAGGDGSSTQSPDSAATSSDDATTQVDARSPEIDSGSAGETGAQADADQGDDANVTVESAGPSPYAEACMSSMTCTVVGLTCQKFSFGGGAINGYACSQTCQTANDCATSPSGTAPSQCLQFTTSKFCVLTCDANSTDPAVCPSPLKCAADQNAQGICVNL
jgi:hypothetical protein